MNLFFSPSRLSTLIDFYAHRAQQLAAWLRFAEEVAKVEFVGVPDPVKPAALGAYYWWRRCEPFGRVHHVKLCGVELAFLRDDDGAAISTRSALSKVRDSSGLPEEYSAPTCKPKWKLETLGFEPSYPELKAFVCEFAAEIVRDGPGRDAPLYSEHDGYGYFGWLEEGFVRVADRGWLLEHVGFQDWITTVSGEEE